MELLKAGNTQSIETLAEELNTTTDDIRRHIDLLEKTGHLRKQKQESGCSCGCGNSSCQKKHCCNSFWEVC